MEQTIGLIRFAWEAHKVKGDVLNYTLVCNLACVMDERAVSQAVETYLNAIAVWTSWQEQ